MASRSSGNDSSVAIASKHRMNSSDATCGCAAGGVPRTCYACLNEVLEGQAPVRHTLVKLLLEHERSRCSRARMCYASVCSIQSVCA